MGWVLPGTLVAAILVGCATSSGDAFSVVVSTESGQRPSTGDTGTEENAEDGTAAIDRVTIRSDPSGARLYLNGVLRGKTPLELDGRLEAGTYEARVERKGYRDEDFSLTYDGGETTVNVTLKPLTGYVRLIAQPADAILLIDDELVGDHFAELPIGDHTVRVRAFGYHDHVADVHVSEEEVTTVVATLELAAFSISAIQASRGTFNPDNPGLLGSVRIEFQVSGPGTGVMTIADEHDTNVTTLPLPKFTTWHQRMIWDGTRDEGNASVDGPYAVRVVGTGDDGREVSASGPAVVIDRDEVVTIRGMWSGASGLAFAPTAEVLPPRYYGVTVAAMGHRAATSESGCGVRVPGTVGLRVGIGGRTELGASVHAVSCESFELLPIAGSFSAKTQLLGDGQSGLQTAGLVKLVYQPDPRTDSFTNFPGVTVGFPVTLRAGPAMLTGGIELIISPWEPLHDAQATQTAELESWTYGRAGVAIDLGDQFFGLSAAVRSETFARGLRVADALPVKVAAELHALLPNTLLTLTALAGVELESLDSYFVEAGAGFTLTL